MWVKMLTHLFNGQRLSGGHVKPAISGEVCV